MAGGAAIRTTLEYREALAGQLNEAISNIMGEEVVD